MSKLLDRIERLESANNPRYPWETVCWYCAEQGLTETPYEHCEAKRCSAGKTAWARIDADHAARIREAWEVCCRMRGENPEERNRQLIAEDDEERAAWEAKKRQIRERRNA